MSEQPPNGQASDDQPQLSLREGEVAPSRKTLAEILEALPAAPGVYIMKDGRGKPIYIGKAAILRNRVRQYFQPASGDSRDFVPLLEGIVADIETVITSNEKEALLLENTLIKRHQPRFNVNLKDDKNYLVLRLDPEAEWPRLEVVRKLGDDGAYYFGPYHSATACREALRVVNRHFQLRTCTDHVLHNRRRPCLQYQIKRCPGPCVLPVAKEAYAEQVRDVRLFLDGKSEQLFERLTTRMKTAAAATEFEIAAEIRDQIRALETTLEEQRVVSGDFADQDVIGYHREGIALEIAVMSIRAGKLTGSRCFSFTGQEFPDAELLSSFVGLYYDMGALPPDEVLLPIDIEDVGLKSEWLSEKRGNQHRNPQKGSEPPAMGSVQRSWTSPDATTPGRKKRVDVMVPQRGDRRRLVELATKNAAASFATRRNARADSEIALAKLQKRLKLPRPPRVIECYDVSHLQGFATVASMVVFVDGRPDKARYRTYKVRAPASAGATRHNDDFASMYEVLSRRFRRAREADRDGADPGTWKLPDLIVVDGGKGQLAMALAAARDVGVSIGPGADLSIVALAKERDELPDVAIDPKPAEESKRPDRVFLPQAKDPIPIRPNSAEMFVLQQLRDEAHRFAVSFHRGQRRRLTLRSALAAIPGIGAGRQRQLLRHFGSVKRVREASVDDLAAVPGMTRPAAEAVFAHWARQAPEPSPADVAVSIQDDAENQAEELAIDDAFAAMAADAAAAPPETPATTDAEGQKQEI
jgi:excinuclease ABC subunit C